MSYSHPQTYSYEYTDTFNGEANYCWCKRGEVIATSHHQAIRLIKAELGITGVRFRRNSGYGDMIRYDEVNASRVLFVS